MPGYRWARETGAGWCITALPPCPAPVSMSVAFVFFLLRLQPQRGFLKSQDPFTTCTLCPGPSMFVQ